MDDGDAADNNNNIIISFMEGIYTYIPETNYVPREYSVAAILLLLFMVLISLVPVLNLLYFYISTFWSMCAVPNMAFFLESLDFMFSWYVAHVFSNGKSRPYYYWYHLWFLLIIIIITTTTTTTMD